MAHEPVPVLIVDDLPSFRAAAAATVAATDGFRLAGVAANGDEALHLLTFSPVELVLMDVHMPIADGHVVAAQMRARYPQLSVVLLSVDPTPEVRAAAKQQGVKFVPKAEFGPEMLEAIWSSRPTED